MARVHTHASSSNSLADNIVWNFNGACSPSPHLHSIFKSKRLISMCQVTTLKELLLLMELLQTGIRWCSVCPAELIWHLGEINSQRRKATLWGLMVYLRTCRFSRGLSQAISHITEAVR